MRWQLRRRTPDNKGIELNKVGIYRTWYEYGQNGVGTVTVVAPSAELAIATVLADNPDENRRVYSVERIDHRVIVYEAPTPEST